MNLIRTPGGLMLRRAGRITIMRRVAARSKSSDAASTTPSWSTKSSLDISDVASAHGVRLTKTELSCLRKQLDVNMDGRVSSAELAKAGKQAIELRWKRELCLSVVEKPHSKAEHLGSRVLSYLDYGGTALFSVVGTQLAGEQGMNLIGCGLVGCIAGMGGGTLNNLLYGSSALLLDKPGVFWVRTPTYLVVAVAASVVTFYSWPLICRQVAKEQVDRFIGSDNLNEDGSVGKKSFCEACHRDKEFARNIAVAFGMDSAAASPSELFLAADADKTGKVSLSEMEAVVAKQFDASPTMYALDTAALAAFAVVAVNGAVQRGLHPVVAASSGVTICFGGILRDVLCGRDLAIGGQSYAFATGIGSVVYVVLRELRLRGLPAPLLVRIVCAFATTTGLRAWEYIRGKPLLRAMHFHNDADPRLVKSLNRRATEKTL